MLYRECGQLLAHESKQLVSESRHDIHLEHLFPPTPALVQGPHALGYSQLFIGRSSLYIAIDATAMRLRVMVAKTLISILYALVFS